MRPMVEACDPSWLALPASAEDTVGHPDQDTRRVVYPRNRRRQAELVAHVAWVNRPTPGWLGAAETYRVREQLEERLDLIEPFNDCWADQLLMHITHEWAWGPDPLQHGIEFMLRRIPSRHWAQVVQDAIHRIPTTTTVPDGNATDRLAQLANHLEQIVEHYYSAPDGLHTPQAADAVATYLEGCLPYTDNAMFTGCTPEDRHDQLDWRRVDIARGPDGQPKQRADDERCGWDHDMAPAGTMHIRRHRLSRVYQARMQGLSRRADETGIQVRQLHRAVTDGRVFRQRRRAPGGTVLLDGSGSMRLSDPDIEALLHARPAATLAVYNAGSCEGTLHIVAERGRAVPTITGIRWDGCSNVIDVPALAWLCRQPGPRYWISDGGVTGIGDQESRLVSFQCGQLLEQGRIQQIATIAQLLRRLRA